VDSIPAGQLPRQSEAQPARPQWLLGCQAYTFRHVTFFEAIEKISRLGLAYVEAYPGQTLSKEKPRARMDIGLSGSLRREVRARLDDAGVKMIHFGVCRLTNDEAAARKTFDFAKEMGIETVVSEPPEDAFDMLDRLCGDYQINLAIHNHPKPSHYWDYRRVLSVCKGRSNRIGACGDTGHCMRAANRPIAALRALEGRIISLHLKDLNEFGKRRAHDVPWGTGQADVQAILGELRRQSFRGSYVIEYERNSPDLMADVAKCVQFFNTAAGDLGEAASHHRPS